MNLGLNVASLDLSEHHDTHLLIESYAYEV